MAEQLIIPLANEIVAISDSIFIKISESIQPFPKFKSNLKGMDATTKVSAQPSRVFGNPFLPPHFLKDFDFYIYF